MLRRSHAFHLLLALALIGALVTFYEIFLA